MIERLRVCSTISAVLIVTTYHSVHCLRMPVSSPSFAFVSISFPSNESLRRYKANAESFDAVEPEVNPDYQEGMVNYGGDDPARVQDMMPPTVNTVTICGRIGYIDQPVSLGNGYKALKLAIATSERGKMGTIKTLWHKIVIYGQGNVDYIHSRTRVGDRALVIGTLTYYSPPQPEGSQYRAKIAEVAVRSRASGHNFILMPKMRQPNDEYGGGVTDDPGYNFNNI